MSNLSTLPIILVPQGAEYQAICKGLRNITDIKPIVVPIKVGIRSLKKYLLSGEISEQLFKNPQPRILVMGLCGSLNPAFREGQIVLYQDCVYQGAASSFRLTCNSDFTDELYSFLKEKVSIVQALTSDRVICSAAEKQDRRIALNTDVVDMEGFAILEFFNEIGAEVAMLRVVSDGCSFDLPDLNPALSASGELEPLALAIAMLKQPVAATRLIKGSILGLSILQSVTSMLFS